MVAEWAVAEVEWEAEAAAVEEQVYLSLVASLAHGECCTKLTQ